MIVSTGYSHLDWRAFIGTPEVGDKRAMSREIVHLRQMVAGLHANKLKEFFAPAQENDEDLYIKITASNGDGTYDCDLYDSFGGSVTETGYVCKLNEIAATDYPAVVNHFFHAKPSPDDDADFIAAVDVWK
jgi:hypothetical protein